MRFFFDDGIDIDKISAWLKNSDFFAHKLFKFFILVVIAVGVWIGCYIFFLEPKCKVLQKMVTEEGALRTQFLLQKKDLQTLDSYTVVLKKLQDMYHKNMLLLNQPIALDGVLKDINKIGVNNHFIFDSFKPNDVVQKEFYTVFPMSVIVSGKYAHFVKFCYELAQLPRLFSVDSVEIVRKNVEEDMLKISFIINVFRSREEMNPA